MFPKPYLFEGEVFQIEAHDKEVLVTLSTGPDVIRIRPHPEGYQITWADDADQIYPLPIDAVTRACEVLLGIRASREDMRRAVRERSQRLNDLHRFVEDLPNNLMEGRP